MAYVTQADLDKRFGPEIAQLVDRNNDGTPDPGVFDMAAQDADAQINGYLGSRYALPLSPVPDLVKELAADITRYELWDDKAPEEVRKRYEDAIARLKDIAKGLIVLPGADGAPVEAVVGTMAYTERTRQFTDDTLADFVDGPSSSRGFW